MTMPREFVVIETRTTMSIRRLQWIVAMLVERAVLTSFVVAFLVRLLAAVAINVFHEGVLIPDEGQYLILALVASEGELTADFWGGYGQSLFDSTRAFMWPLTALFWLFGPSRFLAQLLPVFFGAVTAAATTLIARRFLQRPFDLIAGLIVALFPSQILWSSVVLRESLVWAGLAGIAVLVGYSYQQRSVARIVGSALLAGFLFIGLAWLRDHTAALALWCLFPAFLVGQGWRSVRVISALCVLVFAPWFVGMGPVGTTFAGKALGNLGTSRCYMSMEADSSYGDCQDELELSDCLSWLEKETGEWHEISSTAGRLLDRHTGDWACAPVGDSKALLIDNTLGSAPEMVPRGLFNTMVRPLPGEARAGSNVSFAGVESVLWVTLYGLSAYGVWKNRKNIGETVFLLLIVGVVSLTGAVTHGNLGTAFRHRGQLLFAFAILAAAGLKAMVDRRNNRQDRGEPVDQVDLGFGPGV